MLGCHLYFQTFFKLHALVKPILKKNRVASGTTRSASVAILSKECTFYNALNFFIDNLILFTSLLFTKIFDDFATVE